MTALVVLPGLDGTSSLLIAFADIARQHFSSVRVVSYPVDRVMDYAALEEVVRTALPVDEPFVLLGESFSGPIALAIAASPPAGLVGLVLSTTFSERPIPQLSRFAPLTAVAPIRVLPSPLLSWLLLGRWATPGLMSFLQQAVAAVSPPVLRARVANALRVSVSAILGNISVPVLYLRATEDRLLAPAAGDRILAAIPRAKLIEIAGPHLLLQAAPEQSVRAIVEFCSESSL